MLRRRTVTALCAALLLSLAAPTAALAQEEPDVISDVTIESATVDMETGIATVTVSVTCFVDVLVVRVEADLIQSYGSGTWRRHTSRAPAPVPARRVKCSPSRSTTGTSRAGSFPGPRRSADSWRR
jgi:hypothetical protein